MKESITYVHKNPASLLSQMLQSFMAIFQMKNSIEKRMKTKKFVHKAAAIPRSLKNSNDYHILQKNKRQIWVLKPKQNASEKVIFYLHGGAYIFNISKYHWNFVEHLLKETYTTIIVPDYPLVPSANCTDVYNFIETIYDEYFKEFPSNEIVFMGDSAGAGLALGFAQNLRNKKKKQPSQIIMLSPWLDVTMSNSGINILEKKDKVLGAKGLKMVGEAYADTTDKMDFRVSPIYGNFYGLGKISVFIGTNELFYADTQELRDLLTKQNIPINYFEYPEMFHDWPIFTKLKESGDAIKKITSLINSGCLD